MFGEFIVCGNFTPTESLQTNFTTKFTKIYIFFTIKMDGDDDDIIIAATIRGRQNL